MAKKGDGPDDETGVDPASVDGEGATDDELKARRQKRNGGGSSATRAEEEQRRLDAEDEPKDGEGVGEEDDGQLFVWEQGRKVTLGTLIARGTPVEHAFVFGGRRTKGGGGLMGFGEKPLMIVRGGVGPVKIVPTYDDDEKVSSVVIEQHVNAKVVHPADSEDGLALIAHVLDAKGYVRSGTAA